VIAYPKVQRPFLDPRAAPATQVLAAIDPIVTIAALLSCIALFGVQIDGPYLILVLLVFSLTFPGGSPSAGGLRTLVSDVTASWCATVGLLLFIGWATRTIDVFDRRVLVAWLLATPIARVVAHWAMPRLLLRVLSGEHARRVAVIAGANELGLALAERIRSNPLLSVRVAGFFDDSPAANAPQPPTGTMLGSLDRLADYAKTHRVDLIYITLPMASQSRIAQLLHALRDTTASIYFAPDVFLCDLIQARIDTLGGMPVVSLCETPFMGLSGIVKRASDVLLAAIACIVTLPLQLFIAIGIKFSSAGPVIFKQRRYGLDGQEIIVYKYRTMTVAEDGQVIRQATRSDPRVTPFGAFLRRHSLDELPQFINVLQGRMSVVGPRPHAVAHTDTYRRLIPGYMIRHKVRPGITGWAQVNGLRGETDTLDKMERRIAFDLAYLRNWSLQLDLLIVLRTVLIVVRPRDVY
jgi:putative colanic acid biosynthesis UDP-glucose lipid carrier transferase